MVSVGVSQLGCTELVFVDPGTKINGAYYRDVLLRQKLLPAIRRISGKNFIFQQDSARAHRARETVEVLRRETPDFISPDLWQLQTVQISIQLFTKFGLSCSIVYTRGKSTPSTN